jgi:MFS family permease
VLLFGIGSGLVTPTLFTGLSTLAPDHLRGGVMSLQTTTIGLGQAAGPAAFTLLAARFGYQPTFFLASGAAAIGTALIAVAGGGRFS